MATVSEALADKDARHVLSFSGGKDSTALAIYLLEKHPDLKLEFLFCDTGAELQETYDFISRFEAIYGVSIKRLNALDDLGIKIKGDRNPFDIYLKEHYGGYLPSPQARWCTRMLKIRPFERELSGGKAYSFIGIRADENRVGYQQQKKPVVLSDAPNIIPVYPFQEDGIVLADVKRILEESGLGMPSYYDWRSRSGCYFCFYQSIGEWQRLKKYHPILFEKAKKYEKNENGRKYSWVSGRSLEDLERIEQEYDLPDEAEAGGCAMCHL